MSYLRKYHRWRNISATCSKMLLLPSSAAYCICSNLLKSGTAFLAKHTNISNKKYRWPISLLTWVLQESHSAGSGGRFRTCDIYHIFFVSFFLFHVPTLLS